MSARVMYGLAWTMLALATMVLLAAQGDLTTAAVMLLAWFGGVVSDRLWLELRKDR